MEIDCEDDNDNACNGDNDFLLKPFYLITKAFKQSRNLFI